SVNAAYDTFTAGDSTASGNPVSLSAADPPMLLAAIVLSAPTNSVHAGDVDTISLVPLSGTGSMAGGTPTFFDVVDFSNTGLETSAVPFTSTSGTVQITAAAPVPEPASRITTLTGAILLMAYGMGRRRRPRAHRPESP
ncbi:MAG TPA: hypothetical protein VFF52_17030, partial [Isosphaeraceae bacterium]|nr:hypothetical protein [Isosphaeraceae bacterium]